MPTFQYKAKDKTAQTVTGQVEAANEEQAIEIINQRGLLPIAVYQGTQTLNSSVPLKPRKIKTKELYIFSRQLSSLIKAGVPILQALSMMREQTHAPYLKGVIAAIYQGIRDGKSFSECLAGYPKIFNAFYVAMIKVGEEGGTLKEMLLRLSEYLQSQEEIFSRVRSALAYPVLMMFVGLGTVVFILTFVMPKITALFSNMSEQLPLPTKILMSVSAFLENGWMAVSIAVLAVILFLRTWGQSEKGRQALSELKMQTPFLKDFILKVELARFCRTLEVLLKSGVPLLKGLEIAIPTLTNDVVKKELGHCRKDLESGARLTESLKKSKIVPAMMTGILSIGEESGALEATLKEIADAYEQETNETIKTMTSLLEPLLILSIGLVIGAIVLAMLLPIFQIDILAR